MTGIPAFTASDGSARSAYCIDVTEVTAREYAACVVAGACKALDVEVCADPTADVASMPARCVGGQQAMAFCSWRGKHLPTNAEWVFAACGGDGRLYPWGNAEPTTQVCWMGAPGGARGTTDRRPCAVGSFPVGASPFGMLDAAGNVEEWITVDDARHSPGVRGGGYTGSFLSMRCTAHPLVEPNDLQLDRGFRCASQPSRP
jgi:formylglycine-generating enzyme required for sulfatase activity